MMLPEVVAFIHVPSKRSLRKIRRRALLTEEQEDSILKFRIHLLTATMTVRARDRVASRNTSTERDAKTKIAYLKTTARASWCANIVETAIIGSAKAI
jgi:hypothetical protein